MADANATSPAAVAYAQAMLELAPDDAAASDVAGELAAIGQLMRDEPLFRLFLLDPAMSTQERWTVLKNIFEHRVGPIMLNFLGVLNEKGRFALFTQITAAYGELLDAKANRVRVQVTVAQPLDEEQLQEVRQRVGRALGKTAIVEQKIDDSIIGGLVVRVQDKVMDASVRAQLQAMRQQLLAAKLEI